MQKKLALAAAVIHGRESFSGRAFEGVDALAAGALKALLANDRARRDYFF